MKKIRVSAGVIHDGARILATKRKNGDFMDKWEFPGGKREDGETGEETIRRELFEELGVEVDVERYLGTVEYDYPEFHLTMDVYLCRIIEGEVKFAVHDDGKWIKEDEIETLDWLPSDILVHKLL